MSESGQVTSTNTTPTQSTPPVSMICTQEEINLPNYYSNMVDQLSLSGTIKMSHWSKS